MAVAGDLSLRRVANAGAAIYCRYQSEIDDASIKSGISREIITAVIARESNGRNIIGDGGHGHGLMQIDDRVPTYREWLKRHRSGLDARTNILFGAQIIQENLKRFAGNIKLALAAYNAGASRVLRAVREGLDPDRFTTGKNYSRDVLLRSERVRDQLQQGVSNGEYSHSERRNGGIARSQVLAGP